MNPLYKSATNFNEVRDGRRSPVYYVDVDLSTARNAASLSSLILPISGNSFYINANPNDGNAFVHFQDTNYDNAPAPLYVSPGAIFKIPFTQVMIENTAQPGKKIRIVYGVDVDFQPGSVAQIAVTNAGGYSSIRTEAPTGFYASQTALAAGGVDTVFTPAANVNGALILTASAMTWTAVGSNTVSLVAKTSAPTTLIDGEVVDFTRGYAVNANTLFSNFLIEIPQYIAAGKGLYFYSNAAENTPTRACRYKLL